MEKGFIHGWRCRKKKGLLCGVKEVEGIVSERVLLGVGDYIMPGDSIDVTGKNAEFSLSWYEKGIVIDEWFTVKFRTAQSWVVPKDFCETNKDYDYENAHMRDVLKLPLRLPGLFWIGIKHLATGGQGFQVETERATCGNCRGTQFTIETKDNEDIIKMVEGSMDVWVKKFDDSEVKSYTGELQKLNEDFQSGKLSIEEYKKKAEEFAKTYSSMGDPKKTKVTLEAGYMCTVGKTIGEVIPIPADDVKWWEDENNK